MDDKLAAAIAAAPKQVLVAVVKIAQKEGKQGSEGAWKGFLNVHDKKFGSSLSDPARRSHETLVSFLKTFKDKESSKFVANVLRSLSNRHLLEQVENVSPDNESPEQRLVRLTLEHPYYLSRYSFPSYNESWVVTKFKKKSKSLRSEEMFAIDCEMVLCEDGTDALVRVCVVDRNLEVKLDEQVNPYKPIADYRTEITGVAAGDLDGVTSSLADVQKSMRKLLSRGAVLVGHGLYNDLQVLKLDHARVIDTSFLFKTTDGRPTSLSNLCKSVLGYDLRKEGAPHNCLDDACAAMKIVLAKIDLGVDNDFPVIQKEIKDVLETEMAMILVHKIPINVPSEELRGIFPGNFTMKLKPPKKAVYSALAIFENPQEALKAYDSVDGILDKDSNGREQKKITVILSSGDLASIFIRKTAHDFHSDMVSSKKRAFPEESSVESKELKIDKLGVHLEEIERLKQELREKEVGQYNDHLKEIDRLKQELRSKDFQISTQDKIIIGLEKQLEEMKRIRKIGC